MYHSSVALDPTSFYVLWNGTDVTSQFSTSFYAGTGSASTLAVRAGYRNTLQVTIADDQEFYTTKNFSYTSTLPPDPIVGVTPDGDPRGVSPGATVTQRFAIANARTTSRTFSLTRSCSGAVISCGVPSPASVAVPAFSTAEAIVTFTVNGTSGATGALTMTATDQAESQNADAGGIAVLVNAAAQSELPVPGPLHRIDRAHCLTVAAGPDAAAECGDLRLGHALPDVPPISGPVLMSVRAVG